MERKCLILTPISDPEGYAQGHFNRVYRYLLVPACQSAGFVPVRAVDISSTDIVTDILKNVVECEIAICDISSKNQNALLAFAIRQAMNLPFVLIKDMKTKTKFDVSEFGGLEYDESLRIDTVENETAMLSDAVRKTFATKAAPPALLSRIGVGAIVEEEVAPSPSEEEKKKERHLPVISPLPDYVGEPITALEIEKLKTGDFVFHMNYGKAEIKTLRKAARDKIAELQFESSEVKNLVLVPTGVFRKIKES